MLKNLNSNIVVPTGLKMNNDFDTYGGVLAWSGWVFIYSSENNGISNLKQRISNFNLVSKPV
ncbi:TPA: hypothetical protein ACWWCM_002768 [Enterococcus faecium]|uniref:hypothetical protein n=1 Tax=Enterococcus sp. (strain 3G1_DIV0629) TaxID=1834176 RepID=UPI000A33FC3A|nr:hypothetical protein [Enterococcus sp. 3G1_DIV0629]EME3582449.1 hypothetical protein [Enterococcus faecium]OTO22267.1 hypothetical protein A5816_002939 [Enterococcus sp. 3G1_DIV0629]